jgi:hypothetical protein
MKKSLIQFFISNFSFLILLFATSGCSILIRSNWDDDESTAGSLKPPYAPVCQEVIGGGKIAAHLVTHGIEGGKAGVFPIALIVGVCSFPFDIVTDTVCLPYDLFSYFSDKEDMKFWEDVFERNDTSLLLEEYKKHLSCVGTIHAKNLLQWDKQGYRLVEYDEEGRSKIKRIPHPQGKISPEMRALLERITAKPPRPNSKNSDIESPQRFQPLNPN